MEGAINSSCSERVRDASHRQVIDDFRGGDAGDISPLRSGVYLQVALSCLSSYSCIHITAILSFCFAPRCSSLTRRRACWHLLRCVWKTSRYFRSMEDACSSSDVDEAISGGDDIIRGGDDYSSVVEAPNVARTLMPLAHRYQWQWQCSMYYNCVAF